MSASAQRNGWHGFETAGGVRRVEKGEFGHGPERGGWLYICDGMPTMMGCGAEVIVPRKWSRVGLKRASGWLVCYGLEAKPGTPGRFDDPDQWEPDEDVVLTYCPRCAAVIKQQDEKWGKTVSVAAKDS